MRNIANRQLVYGNSCPGSRPNVVQPCWYMISNVLPVHKTHILVTQFIEGEVKFVQNLQYLKISLIKRKPQCVVYNGDLWGMEIVHASQKRRRSETRMYRWT
ncbi:hypothetical protein K474DRAFT_1655193 [Panus rudis PR-1116 ss-1]|nr:hypothetical protein K474DRAFT_1665903 [Panus rudis PR-1116 ss-1]KAI0082427.1 hypothetical protein K474DRAFT_1655193 [Panus rudis PR-1116 ss-1]